MRLAGLLLVLLLAPAPALAQSAARSAAAPAAIPVYGFEIVHRYPHDPDAFTQGLEFRDGELLESTGRYPSTVRRVRLEDGVVLQRRELDSASFGEGLTTFDDRVLTLTWKGGKGFIWTLDGLEPKGEFAYAGEGWGLTHDTTRLILSDGTPTLRFLDPQTLAETGRPHQPGHGPGERHHRPDRPDARPVGPRPDRCGPERHRLGRSRPPAVRHRQELADPVRNPPHRAALAAALLGAAVRRLRLLDPTRRTIVGSGHRAPPCRPDAVWRFAHASAQAARDRVA